MLCLGPAQEPVECRTNVMRMPRVGPRVPFLYTLLGSFEAHNFVNIFLFHLCIVFVVLFFVHCCYCFSEILLYSAVMPSKVIN